MAKKIVLKVRAEIDCPLFRVGDQMVLDLPGAVMGDSTGLCALSIAKFLAETSKEGCPNVRPPLSSRQFFCPRQQNPVLFAIEEREVRHLPNLSTTDLQAGDIASVVAWLRSVPIFRALPAPVLGALSHRIGLKHFKDGDHILQKGDLGQAFFVLRSGSVEIIDYASEKLSSVVTRLKERDCFGEMSLLTGAPCAATVVARGEVSTLAIFKDDFDQLLRENPYIASRFTRLLASRLLATNYLVVQEGTKSFAGKLRAMNLPTVLQVISNDGRSGTLVVSDENGARGKMSFFEGRIFDAEVGGHLGEEAIYHLLTWTQGDFWMDPDAIPTEDKINESVMGLLMEGMRRIDEVTEISLD